MVKLFKYLPMIAAFKDVSAAYEEEHDAKRPFWLARRFWGAAVTLIATFIGIYFCITLDVQQLSQLADHIQTMIAAGTAIYGIVLGIVGQIKKQDKPNLPKEA